MAERLYHFTCSHGRQGIGTGPNCLLLPNLHPWLGVKLVWFTSQPEPKRVSVGLTSRIIKCDRMEYRYVMTSLENCLPWLDSHERNSLSTEHLEAFEHDDEGEGAVRPDTWWISRVPVRASFDRQWSLGGVPAIA